MAVILGIEARWDSWTAVRGLIVFGWMLLAVFYWFWRAWWNAGWQLYFPKPGDEVVAAVERVGGYVVLVAPLLSTALLRASRRWLFAAGMVAAIGVWRVVRTLQTPVPDDPAVLPSVRVDPPPWLELPYSAAIFWASLLAVAWIWIMGRRRRTVVAHRSDRIEA